MKTLVLALNPSIDVEWKVDDVRWEEKNVVDSQRRWPGGKGVNVARWLRFLRSPAELLTPLGGRNGAELLVGLKSEKLPAQVFKIREETRANIIVSTAAGRQLRFNPHGPRLTAQEKIGLVHTFDGICRRAGLVVLSGSLPRGLDCGFYRKLIERANGFGKKTLLDCDGEAFAQAIRAQPFLVKPNEHELAQWSRAKLSNETHLLKAATHLAETTGGWVLLSRGSKGALLVNVIERKCFVAKPLKVSVQNTVGAGDSMLAAVASEIQRDRPPIEWLRAGVAVGTAAVQVKAGDLPSASLIRSLRNQIQISERAI